MKAKTRVFVGVCAATIFLTPLIFPPTTKGAAGQSVCKIEVRSGYRYIDANGIPDHPTGTFPNRGNPNSISAQNYHYKVPVSPTPNQSRNPELKRGYVFGVAINGVPFDPGTAELWNNDFRWHYEALSGLLASRGSLGADENFAHVQPNGAYHYHGLPMGLLRRLNYQTRMSLVGYAADGYPIYGPYCYKNANDPKSGLKVMKSSYRLRNGSRPSGNDGPGGAYDGSFASDYEYVKGLADLDEYNGRVGVTPEYPGGTFYYVLTDNYPFVPRMFKGEPDSSFKKEGPGGGPPGGGVNVRPGGGFSGGGNNFPGGPPRRFPGGPPGMDFPGGRPPGPPPNWGPPSGGPPNGGPPNGGPPQGQSQE